VPAADHAGIQRVREAAARKGVDLDIRVFDESTHTAADASAALDAELGQIVKSLVFVAPAEGGTLEPVLCLVSGPNRVDVARLAAVTGDRDIRRATAREAQELTGFTIGGIPPFGHARTVRTIMDPDLGRFQTVWAAAGSATAVFPVPPATLRILANATVAPITEERRAADIEAEAQAQGQAGRDVEAAAQAGRDMKAEARRDVEAHGQTRRDPEGAVGGPVDDAAATSSAGA
jgi:prolyl-tRNA editing enzyme YbaK/EbsC (Cys-tRNA(Pro) deacylase)